MQTINRQQLHSLRPLKSSAAPTLPAAEPPSTLKSHGAISYGIATPPMAWLPCVGCCTAYQCKKKYRQQGQRPVGKVKPGYEPCYLYAALQPFSGRLISLMLPDMTKESFEAFIVFLKERHKSYMGRQKGC